MQPYLPEVRADRRRRTHASFACGGDASPSRVIERRVGEAQRQRVLNCEVLIHITDIDN